MGTQIIDLNSIKIEHMNIVGEKAFDISRLFKHNFCVPEGFCVTKIAFAQYVSPLSEHIKRLDLYEDEKDIRSLAFEIRNTILDVKLKRELIDIIEYKAGKIGSEKCFAIRSSIISGCGADASFIKPPAYLNIKYDQIVASIINSWAAVFSDEAVMLRKKNNIKNTDASVCIIVQEMIHGVKQGIVYTADPVSNNKRKATIRVLYSFKDFSEQYIVDKRTLRTIERTASGEIANDASSADNNQITELLKICLKAEEVFGSSQEIDWIMDNNSDIYILQAKTMQNWFPFPDDEDMDYHVYLSFGHIISNTMAMSPLSQSLIKYLMPFGKCASRFDCTRKYIVSAGGRLYIDVSRLLASKKIARHIVNAVGKIDSFMAEETAKILEKKAIYKNKKKTGFFRLILRFFPLLAKSIYIMFFKENINTVHSVNAALEDYCGETCCYIASAGSDAAKIERIKEKMPVILNDFIKLAGPYILADILSCALLRKIFAKNKFDESLIAKLSQGLKGNITAEMGLMFSDITDLFRKTPDFAYMLDYVNYEFFKEELEAKGDSQFVKTVLEFFNKYACRGIGDFDIASDRWDENPSLLFENIKAGIIHCEEGASRKKYACAENENIAAVLEIEQKFKSRLVHRLSNNILDLSPLREYPEYMLMRIMKTVKDIIINAGKTLEKEGSISDRFDVFYLEINEILEGLRTQRDLSDRVVKRKKEHKKYCRLSPPRVIASEGETVQSCFLQDIFEDAARGIGVSPGTVEGRAKVISEPSRKRIRKGEILIIPSMDAAWTPLIMNAAAVVSEVGGQISAPAAIAREMGIPAVVSADNCTRMFKTGDYIKVDGDNGFVIKLNE